MVGARLECNIDRRPGGLVASHVEGLRFRMGSATGLGMATSNNNAIRVLVKPDDHTPHSRIGRNLSQPPGRKAERVFHVVGVEIGGHGQQSRPRGPDMTTGEMLGKTGASLSVKTVFVIKLA